MRKAVDYIFLVQQKERRPLARILAIDAKNELRKVREVCERLRQGNDTAEIHYARHPHDDTIVIMEKLDEEP